MVLYDPVKTSDDLQQAVCETVTHELAHQVSQISGQKTKKLRNEGYNLTASLKGRKISIDSTKSNKGRNETRKYRKRAIRFSARSR